MNTISTIFFDLDGTIVDTEPVAAVAIEQCFHKWGVKLDSNDAHFINGRKWDAAFSFLFRKYRIPVAPGRAAEEIMKKYRELLEQDLKTIPGAVVAVQELSAKYTLGLVSGSNRADILWSLDRLSIQSCFKTILGAEDYAGSKPAPDGYLMGLSELGAQASESLVFEDSHAGIASGRAAGLWVVGIAAANYLKQDQSRAHIQIHDFTSVDSSWVKNLSLKERG